MGIFSSIFGTSKPSDESKFEMLRDDGIRAMQMGELAYAEKCLKMAVGLRADDAAEGLLAEVYLRMQNYEAALPMLEGICSRQPENVEVRLLLARTQGELKLYADERSTCSALMEGHADEPRVLYLAAEADFGLEDLLQAVARLTQCLTLRADYHSARLLRARVLGAMGQWNEALADADELKAAGVAHEDCLLLRARCLAMLGRDEEAAAELEDVCALNPYSQEAILLLGSIYEQTARWDKALMLYDEAVDLQPDFAAAYRARGGVKRHLKDDAGAAEDLKRSLELAPEKAAELDGSYTNVENEMNARYRSLNPYGF